MSVSTSELSSFFKIPNGNFEWSNWCSPQLELKVKSLVERFINSSETNTEDTTKFLTTLQFVNEKYRLIDGTEPFAVEIQKIEELNKKNKPPITRSVKALTSQFESVSAPVRPKIAPSPKSVAPPKPEAKAASIKAKIARLDLNSPNLNTDVKSIIADLGRLKEGQIISEETNVLTQALNKITSQYFLNQADAFIESVSSFLEEHKYPNKIDLDAYKKHKIDQSNEIKSATLKLLKAIADKPNFLINSSETSQCISTLSKFQKSATASFYNGLLIKYKEQLAYFKPELTSKFVELCKMFSNFDNEVTLLLTNQFDLLKNSLDRKSNQLFSTLLPNYSYLICLHEGVHSYFIKQHGHYYLSNFLCTNVKCTWEDPKKGTINSFTTFIEQSFSPKYQWLAENAAHIIKPYNQADDPDMVISGVCFSNCLDRFNLFLDKPTMNPKDIPLEGTKQGRYLHMRSKTAHSLGTEAKFEEVKGLTKVKDLEFIEIKGKHPVDSMLPELLKIKNGSQPAQVMLIFRKKERTGHAINIQIDQKNKVYRFIDDNLGICEYKTEETFKNALNSYLKLYYPEMIEYHIEYYERKK